MNYSDLIFDQAKRYPCLMAQDAVKALYQSIFGCGHMVTECEAGFKRLTDEIYDVSGDKTNDCAVEPIGIDYCRLHLRALPDLGIKPETLFRLFVLSGKIAPGNAKDFEDAAVVLLDLCDSGSLPFARTDVNAVLKRVRESGYAPISHSDSFRKKYNPAYRVVSSKYAKLLKLFRLIDDLDKQKVIIAVDGECASGKSTLAKLLKDVYDCDVFRMDDFFLRPNQRTKERLSTPGGNVDYERFLSEVLIPLKEGREFSYRPYNCHKGALAEPVSVKPKNIAIVEGSYSLHPALQDYYDLKVFMSLSKSLRLDRIARRDGEEMLKRFIEQWIPMEDMYFAATNIRNRCDIELANQEAVK